MKYWLMLQNGRTLHLEEPEERQLNDFVLGIQNWQCIETRLVAAKGIGSNC
jgi:hypothetical protein